MKRQKMKAFFKKAKQFLHVVSVLLLPIFWNCEPDYGNLITSSADLSPSIFCFLNTAADSQYVILRNAVTAQGKDDAWVLEPEFQRLRRASISIQGSGESFIIHNKYEFRESDYDTERDFVFVSAHRVRPGESYWLRVEVPQKGVYTAATTAPGDFQILSPQALDTLDIFDSVIVRWTASEGAAGYRVGLRWTVIDSTELKRGRSEKLDTLYARQSVYVEPSAERVAMVKHNLKLYYESPGAFPRQTLRNDAIVFVEALDTPAWLAHNINSSGEIFGYEQEDRAMPGVYSNIEGGRGVMSATTTKTISLILPPRKK